MLWPSLFPPIIMTGSNQPCGEKYPGLEFNIGHWSKYKASEAKPELFCRPLNHSVGKGTHTYTHMCNYTWGEKLNNPSLFHLTTLLPIEKIFKKMSLVCGLEFNWKSGRSCQGYLFLNTTRSGYVNLTLSHCSIRLEMFCYEANKCLK